MGALVKKEVVECDLGANMSVRNVRELGVILAFCGTWESGTGGFQMHSGVPEHPPDTF
jgi:hypothetical protein